MIIKVLANHRQQATGNRQQATGNRQQATGNRQQATGNYGARSEHVNPPTANNSLFFQNFLHRQKAVLSSGKNTLRWYKTTRNTQVSVPKYQDFNSKTIVFNTITLDFIPKTIVLKTGALDFNSETLEYSSKSMGFKSNAVDFTFKSLEYSPKTKPAILVFKKYTSYSLENIEKITKIEAKTSKGVEK